MSKLLFFQIRVFEITVAKCILQNISAALSEVIIKSNTLGKLSCMLVGADVPMKLRIVKRPLEI